MQIVINIDDEDYQSMKNGHIPFNVLGVLMNGTLLPKHGRLVDGARVEQHLKQKLLKYGIFPQYRQGLEMALNDVVKIAPTIIEAESGDEDETEKA